MRRGYKKKKSKQVERTLIVKGKQQTIFPDKLINKLAYTDLSTAALNNVGLTLASKRWRINDLGDIDPAATASINGYSTLAAIYDYYRVIGIKYVVEFVNREPQAIAVVVAPSQVDLGSNYTAIYKFGITSPYAQHRILSAAGGMDKCKIQGYLDLRRFVGEKGQLYDDTYRGVTPSSGPSDKLWMNIGAVVQGTAALTTGVSYTLKFTLYTQWTSIKGLVV